MLNLLRFREQADYSSFPELAPCNSYLRQRRVRPMCSIDALGVAPMFKRPIFIDSSDPLTNAKISIWLQPDGTGTWQPNEAVVVTGALARMALPSRAAARC